MTLMNVEDYEWIGIIAPGDVRSNVAFLTPLAYFSDGEWKSLALDARRQWFPGNGKVVSFGSDFSGIRMNRLWLFRPELNMQLTDPLPPGYSRYLVNHELEPAPVTQVLDWTARVTDPFDVPELLNQGIDEQECYCQRVFISCQSLIFGPIRLELDAGRYKPREFVHSSSTGGQPLFVWMHTLPEEGTLVLDTTYPRLMLLDESMLDTPTGKEDWSLPQVTIKQVLLASNDAPAAIEGSVHLVDKRIRDLVRLSSKEGPRALHLDPVTLRRAQAILSNQLDSLQGLREVVEQLSDAHPLMKMAREWEVQARSQEIEREAEALTHGKRDLLQQLQSDIKDAEAELEQLQLAANEARESQQQVTSAMNAFEQGLRERLLALKEEPMHILAEHQLVASLLPILLDGGMQRAYEMKTPQPAISTTRDVHSSELQGAISTSGLDWEKKANAEIISVSLQQLPLTKWRQVTQQMGVNAKDVRACAAALLAGLIPALAGEVAIPLLRAAAQFIARGRVVLAQVPITALTTLDLIGSIDAQRQAFIPSNALADAILEAEAHPDDLLLVILEGIDRVPGMPTYMPLLRQYVEMRQYKGDARHTGHIAPVGLFHPRAIAANDPYLKLTRFIWPRNVLLAATLDDDLNSLPLPSTSDPWFVRMNPALKNETAPSLSMVAALYEIAWEQWEKWVQEVHLQAAGRTYPLEHLDYRQSLFHTALTMLHFDEKKADALVEKSWPEQLPPLEEEVL